MGYCRNQITTKTSTIYGSLAHSLACIFFCFTGFIGVWLPYYPVCFPSLRLIKHRCPCCKAVLGIHRPRKFNQCTKAIVCSTAAVIFVSFALTAMFIFVFYIYE